MSLQDRLISACLSAFFMVITVVVVPVAILVVSGGVSRGHSFGWGLFKYFEHFLVWAATVVACATVAGFCLGNTRVTSLFGHLWGTEEPRNFAVSLGLWAALVFLAFVALWLHS